MTEIFVKAKSLEPCCTRTADIPLADQKLDVYLLTFLNQPNIFQATNSLILRSTF